MKMIRSRLTRVKSKPKNPEEDSKAPEIKPIKLPTFEKAMPQNRHLYGEVGLKTLPLEKTTLGVKNSGKAPITPNGYKNATSDSQVFDSYLKPNQEYNIAIATGKVNNLIVLDIDFRNGGLESLKALEKELGRLPFTRIVNTGNGFHIYLKCPEHGLKSGKIAPGIDLLADGKFAVAPPSLHYTGVKYTWKYCLLPRNINDFAKIPKDWLDFILSKGKSSSLENFIPEGNRNDALTSLAGSLIRQGLPVEKILARLKARNIEQCSPPLTDEEVERIVNSIEKYRTSEALGDAERVVNAILADYSFGEWIKYCSHLQAFFVFTGKFWKKYYDKEILQLCLKKCEELQFFRKTRALAKETAELLQMKQTISDDFFHTQKEPPLIINCENGEVWLNKLGEMAFKPHSHLSGMRQILPFNFDSNSEAIEFCEALEAIFQNHEDKETTINFIRMLFGFIIQPSRDGANFVIFHGKGSNGKSKIIEVLEALLGKDGYYSGSLSDLETNKFIIGALNGKLLFVEDDLKAGSRLPDGALKKISESKFISGEEKYKNPTNFICRVMPLISCNNLPSTTDLSEGLKRRLIVVNFNHEFKGDDVDLHLFSRIIRNELAGVLNFALYGWRKFCENGQKFIQSRDMIKAKNEFLAQSNPLLTFIEDECLKNHYVPLDGFYKAYTQWVTESGIKGSQTKQSVRKNLEHQGFNITRKGAGMRIEGLSLKN